MLTSTSRRTELLYSATDGERSDAGRVAKSHLRRGGRADALREMEKGSRNRSYAGR